MPIQKKVFANLFSRSRGSSDGHLKCVIEYTFLQGAARSGKHSVEIGPLGNEGFVTESLKDALCDHLSALYPSETFATKDIVGLGV